VFGPADDRLGRRTALQTNAAVTHFRNCGRVDTWQIGRGSAFGAQQWKLADGAVSAPEAAEEGGGRDVV
jgi:hypothetical protein